MVKFGFETEEIEEGKAKIVVPKTMRGKGPGKREGFPFYNPVMELNRDFSVLVVQKALHVEGPVLLDGLSGTGVRGIRLALEVEGDFSILLNDWNESCYELILENVRRTSLTNATARQEDLNLLLRRNAFDYVDVDPFGTPVPFLESALKGVKDQGVLAVTATDTAALAGSYPNACRRKYDADPLPVTMRHELGLRILIGHCARTAGNHELGIRPFLSHSTDHYYRIYLDIRRGQREAGRSLNNIGYFWRNPSTLEVSLNTKRKNELQVAGPLWIGRLWDPDFLMDLRPRAYMSSKTSKTLDLIKGESEIDSPFYSSDEIASKLGVHTPPISKIVNAVAEAGYEATPTHFDPKGFRTNAPIDAIEEVFRNL